MRYVKKLFHSLLFLTLWAGFSTVAANSTFAQSSNQITDTPYPTDIHPAINKGKLGEQLAICTAYAMIMEKVSITEMEIRDIWRDREIILSKQLKDHLNSHSNQIVLENDIRFIITSNAEWLNNHIFFPDQDGQGVVNPSQEHSVKQYVISFCPSLYAKVDLQIAETKGMVVPDNSVSIMENKKWDEGLIADRVITEDKADAIESYQTTTSSDQTKTNIKTENSSTKLEQAAIIQIAAYMKREHAERGMKHFEEALADIKPPIILQIEQPKNNDDTYFRISTIPMIPDEAKTACNNMKKKQIGCIIRSLE